MEMTTMYVVQKDILDYEEEIETRETIGVCDSLDIATSYIEKLCKNDQYTQVIKHIDNTKIGGVIMECILSNHLTHQYWIQIVNKLNA